MSESRFFIFRHAVLFWNGLYICLMVDNYSNLLSAQGFLHMHTIGEVSLWSSLPREGAVIVTPRLRDFTG